MQVSVDKTSELSRKMTVRVPEGTINKKVDARMKSLTREVKLDGFRPGKVPLSVVKKMYGGRVRAEILDDMIQSTYTEAIQAESLKPSGSPKIVVNEDTMEASDFEYSAEFEVYPEVSLEGLKQIQLSLVKGEVTDADVDAKIEQLRKQHLNWTVVERAAANGDRMTFHFSGVCEDESFTDGKVENHKLVLGSDQMIPGFEEELSGLQAGDSKVFDIQFPEQYGNDKLSGKTASFDVEVISIEESEVPELDADFIANFQLQDNELETFRDQVKINMDIELQRVIAKQTKSKVMEALHANIAINVPSGLIAQEVEHLKTSYQANAKAKARQIPDAEFPMDVIEPEAKRRVEIGLILAEIVQKNDLQASPGRVHAMLENMAQGYENPEDTIKWYYQDKKRLAEIEQIVLEDQALDWILGQVSTIEETQSFDEITQAQKEA